MMERWFVPDPSPHDARGLLAVGRQSSNDREMDGRPRRRREVTLLDVEGSLPAGVRGLLERRYSVRVVHEFPRTREALEEFVGAPALIRVNREAVREALDLCRGLRIAGSRQPIILFSEFPSRSSDRIRALTLGADDYLCGNSLPEELVVRLEARLSRGPGPRKRASYFGTPLHTAEVIQPRGDGAAVTLMPVQGFAEAVRVHSEEDENPRFSVVLFKTRRLGSFVQRQFVRLLAQQVRRDDLDLVGRHAEGVTVYLHGMGAREARRFIARLLVRWAGAGGKEVKFQLFTYPGESDSLLQFIESAEASVSGGSGEAGESPSAAQKASS